MDTVTIYGASDDQIEVDGAIEEEFAAQARPPVNRGGPGGHPWRANPDDLDILASAGEDVPGAAARLGITADALRRWCSRSSRACPNPVRRALLARLERNGATRGRVAA